MTVATLITVYGHFAALDAQTRLNRREFFIERWEKIGATVIFVAHDIDEAIMLGVALVQDLKARQEAVLSA